MRPVERRYRREFFPAMLAYVVLILACTWLLKHPLKDAELWLRAAVSLLPVVPIAFFARALVRFIRDNDELQRRIDLEAIAIATLIVSMGYFTLGLLDAANVISIAGDLAMIWVLPAMCGTFGIVKLFSARRYR